MKTSLSNEEAGQEPENTTGQKVRALPRKAKSLLSQRQGPLPIWIRAPIIGPEHFTGLTRSYLYKLESEGKIVSRCITDPGKVRGCRLFHLQSILQFIDSSTGGEK